MKAGDVFVSTFRTRFLDERFLVVLGVEGPREPGEAAVADVLVLAPANHVAALAKRRVMEVAEIERDWMPVEVAEGGE